MRLWSEFGSIICDLVLWSWAIIVTPGAWGMVNAPQITTPELGMWGWELVHQIKNWSTIIRDRRMHDAHTHAHTHTHTHACTWTLISVMHCSLWLFPQTLTSLLTVIITDQCILVGYDYTTELKLLSSALGFFAHTTQGEILTVP